MTATLELIIWVAINILGIFVFSWLAFISWERKSAVKLDIRSIFKEEKLHEVNKQLRNRCIGVTACSLGVLIGLLPMFGVEIPFQGTSWILIFIVLTIIVVATVDLYGELKA